ncbi:MAG TPA: hypothetical protein VH538_07345 [Gaiellaceae bacterium]|jgi:hypothetical protein
MLTVLQQKLAEAHGLAQAAGVVTVKVAERLEASSLRNTLETMREDAEETRARCLAVEESFSPAAYDEVRAHANSTNDSASDLVGAWFKAGTDPLRAWSFLAMGEAAEVAAWSAVAVLADRAGAGDVAELAAWALPVQRRHLAIALDGSLVLAESFDPTAPRWG